MEIVPPSVRVVLVAAFAAGASVPAQQLAWRGVVTETIEVTRELNGAVATRSVAPAATEIPASGLAVGTFRAESLVASSRVAGLRFTGSGQIPYLPTGQGIAWETGGETFHVRADRPCRGAWIVRFRGDETGGPGPTRYEWSLDFGDDGTDDVTWRAGSTSGWLQHTAEVPADLATETPIRFRHDALVGGPVGHYAYTVEVEFYEGIAAVERYGPCSGGLSFWRHEGNEAELIVLPAGGPLVLATGLFATETFLPAPFWPGCPLLVVPDHLLVLAYQPGHAAQVRLPLRNLPVGLAVHAQAIRFDPANSRVLLSNALRMRGL